MWKYLLEGFTAAPGEQLSLYPREGANWRKLVSDGGLLLALLLSSSWLMLR